MSRSTISVSVDMGGAHAFRDGRMLLSLGRDDDGCVNVLRNVERSSLHCLNR
jgi:hypothetical protein